MPRAAASRARPFAARAGARNDYIYVIIQPQVWEPLMKLIGRPELIEDARYATPEARLSHLDDCFGIIEKWTLTHDKFEAMRLLNDADVPCGPILSMKDLLEDGSLLDSGVIVEVEHPERGVFRTVGNPIRLSDSRVEVETSPLLGEHTEEILSALGYSKRDIEGLRQEGAI